MNLFRIVLPLPTERYALTYIGEPRPWQRAGRGRYGHTFNASAKEQDAIGWEIKAALPALCCKPPDPVRLFGVRAFFFCTLDEHRHRVGSRRKIKGVTKRGDADNLLKNVLDAMTGLIWEDDEQAVELVSRRFLVDAKGPRTVLMFYPITDEYLAMQK